MLAFANRMSRSMSLTLAAYCCVVSACDNVDDGSKETVEAKASALAAYQGPTWDSNGDVVNVCFINILTDANGVASATQKALVKSAISATWAANSSLVFRWPTNLATDLCPQSPPKSGNIPAQYMPIWIHTATGPGDEGGNCAPGYGARQSDIVTYCGGIATCQCEFSTADYESDPTAYLQGAAIHEMGHGLGLPHEHQRTDRPSDIATTCVDPNSLDGVANWQTDGNYAVIPNLILLTKYDGLLSIMSYCRDWDQNGVADFPPYPVVSAMDALGIEMMYPKNFGRHPVLSGFGNSGGSQYIVRSDSSTAISTDWVVRGGMDSSYQAVQWSDSVTGNFSTAPSTSEVITTTRTIKVQLTDAFGRLHPWTTTTAVPNNALFTAVAMSAVRIL